MSTTAIRAFADLVDLADSGETQGRIGRQVWTLMPVENDPGTLVFSSPSTSWCYEINDLRTNQRRREAIKSTAATGRRMRAARKANADGMDPADRDRWYAEHPHSDFE